MPELPDKLYFKIGEVARIVDVKPYVLRYWESEFPMIHPSKTGTHQRLYRKRDIEILLEIKRLLYQERYTIEGAKKRLHSLYHKGAGKEDGAPMECGEYREALAAVREELRELYRLLAW